MAERGRPTIRTAEVEQEIIERLSSGETLLEICAEDHLPCRRAVYNWIDEDPSFSAQIQRAKELGHDAMADQLRQTARGKGESSGDVARDKLIIDTDVRLLARWNPRKYGDKVQHTGDGGGPLLLNVLMDLDRRSNGLPDPSEMDGE